MTGLFSCDLFPLAAIGTGYDELVALLQVAHLVLLFHRLAAEVARDVTIRAVALQVTTQKTTLKFNIALLWTAHDAIVTAVHVFLQINTIYVRHMP